MISKYDKAVVLDALDNWGQDNYIGEDDWWFWEIREVIEKLPEEQRKEEDNYDAGRSL